MKPRSIVFLALSLVVAACGGSAADTTTATTTPTTASPTTAPTTTMEATTTTTEDTRPRSPLNGLPLDDPALLDRRVIAVKIDNHWDARPQSGVEQADAVVELRVEGGLTRFMTLFQVADTDYLGPVRSGRPADIKIIQPLGGPLFTSGASNWVGQAIRRAGVPFFVDTRPGMFRISSRVAPHNLYANTTELRKVADDAGLPDTPPPTGLWQFGPLPSGGTPAAKVDFQFSTSFTASWTWDGSVWKRTINGDEESDWITQDGTTGQYQADVLIAIVGRFFTDRPPKPSDGTPVPSTDTVGSGRVVVFANGTAVEGKWSRSDPTDPFVFTTADGQPLTVPPGHPWISIVPDVGSISY